MLDTGLLHATVPTAGHAERRFLAAELAKLGNITATGEPPGQINDTSTVPGRHHPGNP